MILQSRAIRNIQPPRDRPLWEEYQTEYSGHLYHYLQRMADWWDTTEAIGPRVGYYGPLEHPLSYALAYHGD